MSDDLIRRLRRVGPTKDVDTTWPMMLEAATRIETLESELKDARGKALDKKYPFHGFAPGNYMCKCSICQETFIADKRCMTCGGCAIERYFAALK